MAKRNRRGSGFDLERTRRLAALDAYQRHFGSTTQREDAAADMGVDLATFRELLDGARWLGYDIEARPRPSDLSGEDVPRK
jgi:hypothetical protein